MIFCCASKKRKALFLSLMIGIAVLVNFLIVIPSIGNLNLATVGVKNEKSCYSLVGLRDDLLVLILFLSIINLAISFTILFKSFNKEIKLKNSSERDVCLFVKESKQCHCFGDYRLRI